MKLSFVVKDETYANNAKTAGDEKVKRDKIAPRSIPVLSHYHS
jgi:hypothetical protein